MAGLPPPVGCWNLFRWRSRHSEPSGLKSAMALAGKTVFRDGAFCFEGRRFQPAFDGYGKDVLVFCAMRFSMKGSRYDEPLHTSTFVS